RAVAEVGDDILDADLARDRDAVPATLAVVDEGVAHHLERALRRGGVGQLRLLHQQDVRLGPGDPPVDGVGPGLQRVDVPGGDPHADRVGRKRVRTRPVVTAGAAGARDRFGAPPVALGATYRRSVDSRA